MLTTEDLFDLRHTLARPLLQETKYPWEALDGIEAFLWALGPTLPQTLFDQLQPGVWAAKDARIAPTAWLTAPCVIGRGAELRHGAFIRGGVLMGDGALAGNSVELKNAILLDGAQVPHFNYVGDSILGYRCHLGAGAVTSNIKSDESPVIIRMGSESIPTGRQKIGAMIGDYAEIGCNTVLNPGAVIGRRARVYPLSSVRGTVPPAHIYKSAHEIVPLRESQDGEGVS